MLDPQTKKRRRREKPLVLRLLVFGLFWLCSGFVTGTLFLLGPVRASLLYIRTHGWPHALENPVIWVWLVVLVAVSALLAGVLNGAFWHSRRRWAAAGLLAAPVVMFGLTTRLWLNPAALMSVFGNKAQARDLGRFVFGPYPKQADFARLKREGYAGVITLLHPGVAPFEPMLLAQEREVARATGLTLVEAPMLPWISENTGALAKIKTLAKTTRGRYYVHCYLGQDRVRLVSAMLEKLGVSVTGTQSQRRERLQQMKKFERGGLAHLSANVTLGPFPTQEEFMTYIVNGGVKHLVSLLDADNAERQTLLVQEHQLARDYDLTFYHVPLGERGGFPAERLHKLAQEVKGLSGPVYVHRFFSQGDIPAGFAQAFVTGRAPTPRKDWAKVLSPKEQARLKTVLKNADSP